MEKIKGLYNVRGVYTIECLANGRIYIGQSANLGRRQGEHISSLRRGAHRNKALQEDFDKYGEEQFRFVIIKSGDITESELDETETELIAKCGGVDGGVCYNVFSGGRDGYTANKHFRDVVSKRFTGRKISEEQRAKRSEQAKQQWKDPDYRDTMINSAKSQWLDEKYRSMMVALHTGGQDACGHKLNAEDVVSARMMYSDGKRVSDIARYFGVSYAAMQSAISGRTWKNI